MSVYAHYPSLKGRHVFITGGATGIGASLVEAFAGQGAVVSFIDIAREAGEALALRLGGDVEFALVQAGDHPVGVGWLGGIGRCPRICLSRDEHDPVSRGEDDVARLDQIAHMQRLHLAVLVPELRAAPDGSDFSSA